MAGGEGTVVEVDMSYNLRSTSKEGPMPSIIRVLTGAMLAAALLAPVSVVAQATNVTGDWAFNVQTDQGAGTPALTFKQDGEKLTGKYNGQLGVADLSGTVKGNAIHFTFTVDVQGQQATVTYDGTVEKNTMKGSVNIAGMATGTFTGTKK
jgi:Tol biopolymer transport system component